MAGTLVKPVSAISATVLTQAALCLTPGAAGFISQVTGLASAVGVPTEQVTARLRAPWRWLPLQGVPLFKHVLNFELPSDPPRLIVSCGRQAVVPSLILKRRFGPRVFTVHIQDPTIRSTNFDLVIAPEHDCVSGPNVMQTAGAIHHITAEKLDAVRNHSEPFEHTGSFAAVILGGPNRYYDFSSTDVDRLIANLRPVAERTQLVIVTSRRTPSTAVQKLRSNFGSEHFIWDGGDNNPYLYCLAAASHIIVTADSVSMLTEAAATGKPVYMVDLTERRRATRFRRFHQSFHRRGYVRTFDGELDHWDYEPPNDTARIAQYIRSELGLQ